MIQMMIFLVSEVRKVALKESCQLERTRKRDKVE